MLLKMFHRLVLLLILILPVILIVDNNNGLVRAQVESDPLEAEEEDAQVEMEDTAVPEESPSAVADKEEEDEEEDEEEKPLKPSPDADTYILFTKPPGTSLEIPAGKDVQFLVGFTNKGSQDFTIDTMEASFRYPTDFTFYIQNFSTIAYNKVVKPSQEATLFYTFFTSETFSSRPFGLTVNLMYRDAEGNQYLDAVFNETVNIVEVDEGLDGETFFLYVFLAACVVLLLVAGQQFFYSFGRRRLGTSKPKIEMGTSNPNDVDYDWLPKERLNEINKSPKKSPKQSPRQRRVKRSTGFSDE